MPFTLNLNGKLAGLRNFVPRLSRVKAVFRAGPSLSITSPALQEGLATADFALAGMPFSSFYKIAQLAKGNGRYVGQISFRVETSKPSHLNDGAHQDRPFADGIRRKLVIPEICG